VGALVEILEVRMADDAAEEFRGRFIDLPRPRMCCESRALNVVGWVLERGGPAVAVDIVRDGTDVVRAPVEVLRPDLAAGFPDIPEAGRAGFNATVNVLGDAPELRLEVYVLLRDGRHVRMASLLGRRFWRGSEASAGAELVSIVILAPTDGPPPTAAVESALAQTHPHLEIVIVGEHDSDHVLASSWRDRGVRIVASDESGGAAARNVGLRSTVGDFLVFLDAGRRLASDAVAAGLEVLRERPVLAAAWGRLGGGEAERLGAGAADPHVRRGPAGTAADAAADAGIYRRAAFELVGPFITAADRADEAALRQRFERELPVHVIGRETLPAQAPSPSPAGAGAAGGRPDSTAEARLASSA
jgi:hypothetical protein